MRINTLIICLILTCQGTIKVHAQSAIPGQDEMLEFGLTPRQTEALIKRWGSSQPVVALYVGGEQPVTGQPIYFGRDSILVYPKARLPVGADWHKDLVAVPFSKVTSMALQRGGNWIQRSRSSRFYALRPAGTKTAGTAIVKLHYASIYRDSLVPARDMPDALRHSRVMRQVFPNKHIRISAGIGLGGDVVADDVKEAFSNSPLGDPEYGYGNPADFEWADIAFRMFNRYMIGWQYISNTNYSNWYYYSSGNDYNYSYSYWIELFEHRIYGEYGLFHVDRYFSRPFEWTVGAGIIFARPKKSFYYDYEDFSDPENPDFQYFNDQITGKITGLNLKSMFHYFFVPGLSLYAGLEASFYEKWIIPEQILPTGETGGQTTLPEHEINLNNIRFRAGVSIYL
ncbi:MAG: hypothetical protein ACWGNV_09020 [Bacteroidales bacterium]